MMGAIVRGAPLWELPKSRGPKIAPRCSDLRDSAEESRAQVASIGPPVPVTAKTILCRLSINSIYGGVRGTYKKYGYGRHAMLTRPLLGNSHLCQQEMAAQWEPKAPQSTSSSFDAPMTWRKRFFSMPRDVFCAGSMPKRASYMGIRLLVGLVEN